MDRVVLLTIILFSLALTVFSNPINTYDLPAISEAQISDSLEWAIELGGTETVYLKGYPSASRFFSMYRIFSACSTEIFRIRIASLKKTYPTRLSIDSQGIAVVTRSSIVGIPATEQVAIQQYDTIGLLDTTCHDSVCPYRCWSFVVRPVKKGNSLVNVWYGGGGDPYETANPSIGGLNDYQTAFRLHILNDTTKPVSDLFVYKNSYFGTLERYGYKYVSQTSLPGEIAGIISLAERSVSFAFSTEYINTGFPVSGPFGARWSGGYNDSIDTIVDTIAFAWALSLPGHRVVPDMDRSGFKLSVLPLSSMGAVVFAIVSPRQTNDAVIKMYSVNGKALASIDVPAMRGPGTYSITWENNQGVSGGVYICKLMIEGIAAASSTITMRK
ncbi:MAG: hypothetical protein JW768_10980 [Chitinispirillaceae bacterium]|nr:hypothetical protein [Chitinispirillaceae bacterium]